MLTDEQKQKMQEQNKKMTDTMNKIKHRIVVFSGKGGVGKTIVSVNLSYGLHTAGYKTGILDADVTGPNVPKMVGGGGELNALNDQIIPDQCHGIQVVSVAYMLPENQPVMWRGPMRSKLLYQFLGDVAWGDLDYLIADLPPGTGDDIITLSEKMMPELAVIVTTPQEVALLDSARSINMAKEMKIPKIGLVENMSGLSCPKCGHKIDLFGMGGGKKQAEEMGVEFLGAISIDVEARKMADYGTPIILENPKAIVSMEINDIVKNIINMLN